MVAREIERRASGYILFCLVVLAMALCPRDALAQFYALPSADVDYDYSSNIFAVPANFDSGIRAAGLSVADRTLAESAAAQVLYQWGLQELYANGQAQHISYGQNSDLNHEEYMANGGMKWKLGYLLDGTLDYRYQRNMVQFLEFNGTELLLQHDNTVTANANVQITPEWRLENQAQIDHLDSPRPGLPDLNQTEDRLQERVRYAVATAFTAGLNAGYIHGHFDGDELGFAPEYKQYSAEAAAKYNGSDVTSVDGSVGYTRRTPQDSPAVSGLTGKMDFSHRFSGVTSAYLKAVRAVNTYVTYVGTEVDTSVTIGGSWHPTDKIAVTPSYEWMYSSYPQTQVGLGSERRAEHYQLTSLNARYQVLNWLAFKTFGQYDTRKSNIDTFTFNRTEVGIGVELRLSGQANQPYELTLPD